MQNIFSEQKKELLKVFLLARENKNLILRKVINALAVLAIIVQVTSIISVVSHHNDSSIIISTYSMDAANSIHVAEGTSLINDNGWRPYGPLYYRITKVMSYFNENLFQNYPHNSLKEKHESNLCFYLLMTSVFSILGISILFASTISSNFFSCLLGSVLITNLLLKNANFTNLIFWNHPDLLLAFLSGLFGLFLLRYINDKKIINLALLSLIGGAAFLTKLLFLLIFFPPLLTYVAFNKISIKEFLNISALTAITYLIIGFPQSLAIQGIIQFLLEESSYSTPANLESVSSWLGAVKDLFIPVFFALFILNILLPSIKNKMTNPKKNSLWISLLAFASPIICLLFINKLSNPYYYAIPFTIFLLIYTCSLLNNFFTDLNFKKNNKVYGVIFLLLYFFISKSVVPVEFINESSKFLKDRNDIYELNSFVNSLNPNALKLYTAYFPIAGERYSPYNKALSEESAMLYIYKVKNYKKKQSSSSFKQKIKNELIKVYLDWNSFIQNKPYLSKLKITSRLLKDNLPDNIDPEYLFLSYGWISRYQAEEPRAYDLAGESFESWKFGHNLYSPFKGFDKLNSVVNLGGYSYKLIYSKNINKNLNQIWQLVKER